MIEYLIISTVLLTHILLRSFSDAFVNSLSFALPNKQNIDYFDHIKQQSESVFTNAFLSSNNCQC